MRKQGPEKGSLPLFHSWVGVQDKAWLSFQTPWHCQLGTTSGRPDDSWSPGNPMHHFSLCYDHGPPGLCSWSVLIQPVTELAFCFWGRESHGCLPGGPWLISSSDCMSIYSASVSNMGSMSRMWEFTKATTSHILFCNDCSTKQKETYSFGVSYLIETLLCETLKKELKSWSYQVYPPAPSLSSNFELMNQLKAAF